MVKPITMIEMGTPPSVVIDRVGTQGQWFADALGWKESDFVVYRPEFGDDLPTEAEISCAIISGSWSMVTENLDWSEQVADWVRSALDNQVPILGVCYGHQLMAHALGGKVDANPNGPEQGLHTLCLAKSDSKQDSLLEGLPTEFPAWLCHYQSVIDKPETAEVLLASSMDKHQMLRYNEMTYSVQFHPEFSKKTMHACYLSEEKSNSLLDQTMNIQSEPELALEILKRFTKKFHC